MQKYIFHFYLHIFFNTSSRINYYSVPISCFNPSQFCWSLQAIIFYHECKFIWVFCWWHPLSIQLSELREQEEVIRLTLITLIDKIIITDMFSPLQRPTHASIHLDVDKQYFNEVPSEEVVMNVAGICWRPEWMDFLPLLHADAYALLSLDCNANCAMATVNQCRGVEISIFKWNRWRGIWPGLTLIS